MIKEMLLDGDGLFSKFDLKTVVISPNDKNNMVISCHTDDNMCYLYSKSKIGSYDRKEFALRDWKFIHNVLSIVNSSEIDKLNIEIDDNPTNGYPHLMKVKYNRVNLKHYLQNYSFISQQSDLFESYKKKKITFNVSINNEMDNFDENTFKQLIKLASIVNCSHFTLKVEDNDLYFLLGNENQTVDFVKIKVQEGFPNKDFGQMLFSIEYFKALYQAMKNDDLKIQVANNRIIFTSETDVSEKVAVIRGKGF